MAEEQKTTVVEPGDAEPGQDDLPPFDGDALRPMDSGRYLLGPELGRGGMGRILVAQDRRLARPVAIKELLAPGDKAQRRFEREVRITARLQHPGIVPVYEGGCWPTGEPFYVMKRVSGRTLEAAVLATTSLKERIGLLPNVIAVSDALAYAHEQRVVHRDLKPQNVLVGEFGETVIIDWGLAKDLSAPEAPEDDELIGPYRTRANELTVAGRALGTPAYMPPEQARGEAADARSDVYALGALLHHVLAGAPPYEEGPSESVIGNVLAGPPPSLLECVPDVPADLAAIVAKAMAREPADRYPSAAAVSAELKRFQTGQLVGAHSYSPRTLLARWLRRHRAAVAVATVLGLALAATLVVSVRRVVAERDLAAEQRTLAVGERQAAESLVQFMLVDLRDKLLPIGKLELLEGIGSRVESYYKSLAASVGRLDGARRGQRAAALAILGDVRRVRGDLSGSHSAYEEARDLHQQLAQEEPAQSAWQRGLAHDQLRLGDLDSEGGDENAALVAYRAGLAASERVAMAAAPDDDAAQRGLHMAHLRIGDVLRHQGDDAGAQTQYRAAAAVAERFYDQGGSMASDPALARDQDSRLELFARFTDGTIRQKSQSTANGGWSAWHNTGFVATSAPALFKNSDGRLQVFARGIDGALWTSAQVSAGDGYSSWRSLGGSISGDPAVQQQDDGRLIVFARDAAGDANNHWAIAHVEQTQASAATWSDWSTIAIATPVVARPVSIRNDDGRLEVLVVGFDGHAYTAWQSGKNGGFSVFSTLGGPQLDHDAPLAAARNPDGRLEVFARSQAGEIWSVAQGGPGCCWSWQQLSESGFGPPAVGMQLDGNIMVVASGPSGRAWRLAKAEPTRWPAMSGWKSGSWPAEGRMVAGSAAAIARSADGRSEIFLRGGSGELLHDWQTADGEFR